MRKTIFLLLLSIAFMSCSSHNEMNINQAIELFEAGNEDEAKVIFIKLSKQGNYDADFELAYRYINSYDDQYKYLKNAATHGNEKAMDYFLDIVLFRSDSFTKTDPKIALNVYKKYLRKRNIKESDKKEQIAFLEKCATVPNLDIHKFCKKYKIQLDEQSENTDYYVWQLAEEASKSDGRFGKPNPELILQLILRGGKVPMELTAAVNDYYEYYKKNEVHEFKIDNYVTSGYGINFCTFRAQEKKDILNNKKKNTIINNFSKNNQELLLQAIQNYYRCIDEKIWSEEGNDGSGYITWAYDSANKQKDEFLEYLGKLVIIEKIDSSVKNNINNLILELEKLKEYRNQRLLKSPIKGMNFSISIDDETKIDTLWEIYKNNIINIVEKQFNTATSQELEKWIYNKRIEDLNNLMELFSVYPPES